MASVSFEVDSLESMKRSELQKLCKECGIKANSKTSQLIVDLKTYAGTQGNEEKVKTPVSTKIPENCTPKCNVVAFKSKTDSCGKKSSGSKNNSTTRKRKRTYSVEKVKDQDKAKEDDDDAEVLQESDDDYKKSLLEHLEKTAEKAKNGKCRTSNLMVFGVRMPLYPANQTPDNKHKDWDKVHKNQFDRMDSLDDYLEKKKLRTERLYQSVKKAKLVADDARCAVESLKEHKTPHMKSRRSTKLRKPQIQTSNIFKSTTNKTANSEDFNFKLGSPGFNSKVFHFKGKESSVKKSPKPVESSIKKTSLIPRVQRAIPVSSTRRSIVAPKSADVENKLTKTPNPRKSTVGFTPFKFAASVNTPEPPTSVKKFDLKASLSKPLGYKPYTGKLKIPAYGQTAEDKTKPKCNPYKEAAQKIQQHMKVTRTDVKNVKVATRNDRRKDVVKKRATKRGDALMARRGIKL